VGELQVQKILVRDELTFGIRVVAHVSATPHSENRLNAVAMDPFLNLEFTHPTLPQGRARSVVVEERTGAGYVFDCLEIR
jgi:hypothetical protein